MIRIKIGSNEPREFKDVSPDWINEQINLRRRDGVAVCVRVSIKEGSIDMVLSTPGCQGRGGGGRSPNEQEKQIFGLWEKLHLNKESFTGGNLVAFLKQVSKLL